jgi:hypothetical protein
MHIEFSQGVGIVIRACQKEELQGDSVQFSKCWEAGAQMLDFNVRVLNLELSDLTGHLRIGDSNAILLIADFGACTCTYMLFQTCSIDCIELKPHQDTTYQRTIQS